MIKVTLQATLTLLTICLLCSCGHPEIKSVTNSHVVLAYGDSLTAGYGVSEEDSYPAILAELLGCEVINEGVSGEDTNAGLRRLPETLEAYQPDLVILCMGGNDMLRKQPEGQTIKNLRSMIDQIQATGADIIFVGVPKPGLLLSVPSFYDTIAEDYALPFDDSTLAHILSKSSLKSDQIHPNEQGYRMMAEHIYELIEDSMP